MRMQTSVTGSRPPKGIPRRGRQAAFTLIEVLVVLAILAVAATLIVPRMGRSVEQRELREAAARFAQTARTVRELAVSTRKRCAVEIDLDHRAYGVAMTSTGAGGGEMSEVRASWLKSCRWPESVRDVAYQTPTGSRTTRGMQRLEFFADGTSSGAAIRLTGTTDEYAIVVHAHSGRVTVGDAETISLEPEQYDLGD